MASSIVIGLLSTATLALTVPTAARALRPGLLSRPGAALALRRVTVGVVLVCLAVEAWSRRFAPFGGGGLRGLVGVVRAAVMLLFATLLAVVAAELMGRLVELVARAVALARRRPHPPAMPALEARRAALTQGAAAATLAVGAPAFLRGGLWSRTDFHVHEVEIRIPNLPRALEGLTIVQLTDLHLGVFTGPRELGAVLDRVARLRGDLVVLTGDTFDHNPRHIPEAMRSLARLSARGGVHAILGNHDHYTGPARVAAAFRGAGFRVHINGSTALGPDGARGRGLVLAGLDDIMAPRLGTGPGPDLAAALRGRDPDDPVVLLAHNPQMFPDTRHRVALQLSGHTHGGQINTLGVAGALLPYVAGAYREGDATMFVSRGIGTTGPPVRLDAPPEIVRISLRA